MNNPSKLNHAKTELRELGITDPILVGIGLYVMSESHDEDTADNEGSECD